jgi:hypothetical protein
MPDHQSVTTADGKTGTHFVAAPAGLTAAVMVHHGTICRRTLGPIIGYACFGDGGSEAVYADGGGLRRASTAPLDRHRDGDAVFEVIR